MRYALVGYGRMGRAIEEQASRRGHQAVARLDLVDGVGSELARSDLAGAQLAFEFTVSACARENVQRLISLGLPVICGTTGWEPDAQLARAASEAGVGVVVAPNFSIGMQLFYRVVRHTAALAAATRLHEPYVIEHHHRAKRDAPSGTARRLAEIMIEADPQLQATHEGNPDGPLPAGLLQVSSVRAGGEPGSHTVGFDGEYDQITLEHRARGRAGLALGAVLAAEQLLDLTGLHSFESIVERLLA